MPLYTVDKNKTGLQLVKPSSFVDEQVLERKDLQPLLRDNPEAIDPDIYILAEEFGNWEGSSRRIDLLGLDREGNLVVIELKRVEDGGHMELQALRYAAMLSSLDLNAVVDIHSAFLTKQDKDTSEARPSIINFLQAEGATEVSISNKPRVLLIAPSFSREITTTVLWLNEMGLDIRCLEAKPYRLQNELYLDIEQIIPLPSAQDYMFSLRKKAVEEKNASPRVMGERTLARLAADPKIQIGVRVHLVRLPRPGLNITDEKAKWATMKSKGRDGFEWDYDGGMYSLSGLTRAVCAAFGGNPGSGSFAGPDYWALENETLSLGDYAKSLVSNPIAAEETAL